MNRKLRMFAGLLLALLLVATPAVQAQMTPAVEVSDQEIRNDTVVVDRVVSDGPGWIVIHADDNGAPGDVVGYSTVVDGENADVSVQIDTSLLAVGMSETEAMTDTEGVTLYAMLHTDAGEEGAYEFPGDDTPVTVDGEVVMAPFTVTGLAGMAEQEAEATAEPAATAAPDETQEPETLPETGGTDLPWLPIALVGIGLLIVVGAWLLSRRDTEKVHIDR